MKLVLLKGFNNYYNRIIKTTDDLINSWSDLDVKVFNNINFKYGDGVYTSQVVNMEDNWSPDYCLVMDEDKPLPVPRILPIRAYSGTIKDEDVDADQFATIKKQEYTFNLGAAVAAYDPNYESEYRFDWEIFLPARYVKFKAGPGNIRVDVYTDKHVYQSVVLNDNGFDYNTLSNIGISPGEMLNDIVISGSDADAPADITITAVQTSTIETESRWFVIESFRNRKGQFELGLKRDSIVDNIDKVLDAPMYVEKAKVTTGDVAIYNDEDILLNQIKTNHIDLYDPSGCPWIVGYIERKDASQSENTVKLTINTPVPNYSYNDMDAFYNANPEFRRIHSNLVTQFNPGIVYTDGRQGCSWAVFGTLVYGSNVAAKSMERNTIGSTGNWEFRKKTANIYTNGNSPQTFFRMGSGSLGSVNYDQVRMQNDFNSYCKNYVPVSTFTGLVSNILTQNQADTILSKDGLIYKIGNNYYRSVVVKGATLFNKYDVPWGNNTIQNTLYGYRTSDAYLGKKALSDPNPTLGGSKLGFMVCYEATDIVATLELLPANYQQNLQLTVPNVVDRMSLDDAPYDMFFLPYGDCKVNNLTPGKDFNLKVAMEIAHQLGSRVFDVQILPYCPVQAWLGNKSIFAVATGSKTPIQTDSSTPATLGYIYWAPTSSFTFRLDYWLVGYTDEDPYRWKLANQGTLCRFMSPNSNSMFDINVVKNGGNIRNVKVDCTYRPASPYIHLVPELGGLYGQDFSDKRGLICAGDFSLAKIIDNWVEYQNQNKYYQAIFDRETEHIEFNNRWELGSSISGAITGTLQGGASGAATGMMVGGPYGAIAGAAIGTTTAAIGGGFDIAHTVEMQKENLDYRKDLFNLNLRTIQAQPNSISNISAFDLNNNFVPFMEFYQPTDQEKEAFKQKLIYNGMKVGRIGTMREFLWEDEKTYIKGQLIRLEDSNNDFHEINDIASELNKGVFI